MWMVHGAIASSALVAAMFGLIPPFEGVAVMVIAALLILMDLRRK